MSRSRGQEIEALRKLAGAATAEAAAARALARLLEEIGEESEAFHPGPWRPDFLAAYQAHADALGEWRLIRRGGLAAMMRERAG